MSVSLARRRAVIAPVVALALFATRAVAQTPQPATGGFVAVAGAAPADRIQLTAEQVKTILIARHPAVAGGTSEDNIVTIVLASNGDYVASGTSQGAVAGAVVRAAGTGGSGGTGGGGAFAASGGSGGTVSASSSGGGTGGAGPRPAAVITPRADDGQPHFIKLAGIGDVDASLVKDMYFTHFSPGEVSVNGLSVRVVTLKGTAMK